MRRTSIAAALTLALFSPLGGSTTASTAAAGSPISAESASAGTGITGTWRGRVYGDDGAAAGYGAKVRITKRDGRLRGRVVAGGCIGRWTFDGRSGGTFRFTERITRERAGWNCVKRVKVKVHRSGAKLRVDWREPRSGDTATMLAKPV
ncbi:hypothetical protein [Nocardioides piscis]|uniref:Uncharacterized protein n=1 Tax=Nocardioides piscis TaxID=2714938 RepID=A0A6G7YC44_9ACTN|nr:hypothetical protein [Nocardioides piscis]QIK74208.1 hypothetical protein G7071_00890 [Nocardioides piscis]